MCLYEYVREKQENESMLSIQGSLAVKTWKSLLKKKKFYPVVCHTCLFVVVFVCFFAVVCYKVL